MNRKADMVKEPEIKLFGRKIVSPENGAGSAGGECSGVYSAESGGGGGGDSDRCFEVDEDKQDRAADQDEATVELSETTAQDEDQNPLSEFDNNPKSSLVDDENDDVISASHPTAETEQTDATNKQQKPPKKPDKILPCPRCDSTDTKFCYYNNYNVNQPRHFCKSCQRYWTAGGSMRNVPVGAGRRKNKSSLSHLHQIMISDHTLQAADGLHCLRFQPNGTVLSFGHDLSPYEEKRVPDGVQNGYHKTAESCSVSCKNGENIDDHSTRSCDGGKNTLPQPAMQNVNGLLSPVHCIPAVPLPFPWNPAFPFPAIYPVPYYPTMYSNYVVPNAWNVPSAVLPLGKRSRNGELLKTKTSEVMEPVEPHNAANSPIVVPKTLRIDDPEEAAKSSIWATLGIAYDSSSRECLFKGLQPKEADKKDKVRASPLLLANPAALSRSISFHENA